MDNDSMHQQIKQRHRTILKEQGFKAWLRYFWDYYKLPVIIFIVLIIFGVSLIYSLISRKETVLQIAMINSSIDIPEEDFMADYFSYAGLNDKKEDVYLDTSLYVDVDVLSTADRQTIERLYIMSSAGAIDVLLTDGSYFPDMASEGYLMDLRKIFSEEELEALGDRVFYCNSPHDDIDENLPVGIEISDSERLKNANCYPGKKAYFSVSISSEAAKQARIFYQYLTEQ